MVQGSSNIKTGLICVKKFNISIGYFSSLVTLPFLNINCTSIKIRKDVVKPTLLLLKLIKKKSGQTLVQIAPSLTQDLCYSSVI